MVNIRTARNVRGLHNATGTLSEDIRQGPTKGAGHGGMVGLGPWKMLVTPAG